MGNIQVRKGTNTHMDPCRRLDSLGGLFVLFIILLFIGGFLTFFPATVLVGLGILIPTLIMLEIVDVTLKREHG